MLLPTSFAPSAPPLFNPDAEALKVEAKQFALMAGQSGLLCCVCTVAMCLMRPRKQNYYVDSEDEEDEQSSSN